MMLLFLTTSAIYAQVTFSGPTFVRSYAPTYGDWMDDATDPSGKLWVIPDFETNTVYEYLSMADLLASNIHMTYTLPFSFAGTGHIVWGGNLYYNKLGSNEMIKYNLATQTVLLDVPLTGAGSMNTYHYEWGGYSDIDFAVDENGLWVMYSTAANSGKLVVSSLNPATLAVTNTWNTNSEAKTSMGNAFIINGVVYCVDSYSQINQTVNYTYNTFTSTGSAAAITWTDGDSYMTSLQYNPTTHVIYEWDNDNLYTHSAAVTTINNTVSVGPYCAGSNASVAYTITGTFNAGNIFTAQLSDATGSFASPVNIGTLTSTSGGTINATIPANTTTSSLYRIRVVATNPITTGSDNGSNITINALPTVGFSVSPSSTVCAGTPVTLSGTGAVSYSWTGGVTNAVPFTPVSTLTYTVTGTSAAGCTNTQSETVIVNPLPTVTATSTASVVCTGNSVTLTGGGATSYSWTGGVTNAVPFIPVNTLTYTVTGMDANSCTNTATTTVTVNPLPTVTATSTASVVCTGNSVTLTGGGATSYMWTGGVTNAVPFTPVNTLTYTVTGTDANSCTNTATTTVTVNPLPTVTATSTAAAVCANNSVTLTGGGAVSYTWTGGVTNAISFVPVNTLTYTVTGLDANGCTNTATTTVTVNPLPTLTLTAVSTAPCVTITTDALTGTPVGGTWSGPGVTGTNFDPATAGTGAHVLTYSYTDANGCSNSSTLTINVNVCTGIEVQTFENGISVFPNPNAGEFTLAINANVGDMTIEIMDMQGRVVYSDLESNVSAGFTKQINLDNVATGLYLMRINSGNKQSVEKISIQR